MRILIAIDKFKGSMDAFTVAEVIKEELLSKDATLDIISIPLADGGDGFADIFCNNECKKEVCRSFDPLNREIDTTFYISKNREIIIELSHTCGLSKLSQNEKDPEKTTSYGLGYVINNAISLGYKEFIIGIGGSATNDCGIGMLSALGAIFLDENNSQITPIGKNLSKIKDIITDNLDKKIEGCHFTIACDVKNKLYGENGAAYIYAPQKGANKEMVKRLDQGLKDFSDIVKSKKHISLEDIVGGGAAGGIGAAFSAFLSAKMVSGFDLIAKKTNLNSFIASADLIISGEGKIDLSSFDGKVVGEICKIAKSENKPMIIICGIKGDEITAKTLKDNGIINCVSIVSKAGNIDNSIKNAEKYLREATKELPLF